MTAPVTNARRGGRAAAPLVPFLALSVLALLGLTACGGGEEGGGTARDAARPAAPPEVVGRERWVSPTDTAWDIDTPALWVGSGEGRVLATAKATHDLEYEFPWGWGEMAGVANRTDYDLKAHTAATGRDLSYFVEGTGHIVPYVIEPSFGVDRAVMALLVDAYSEEEVVDAKGKAETRVVLKLHSSVAPVKVAVLPLSKKEPVASRAKEVVAQIRDSGAIQGVIQYDDTQSIGRRYRRQDEVGTPLCVTVDFDSLDDAKVTIRDRDSMEQVRVPIAGLEAELANRLTK